MSEIRIAHQAAELLRSLGDEARSQRLGRLVQGFHVAELRIAVFGEFNRGKSTFINALLGREVLPAKLIPTTGHVTRIEYGESELVRVQRRDGSELRTDLAHLASYCVLDAQGEADAEIDSIVLETPHPLLQSGITLIDTPGVCEHAAQSRRAEAAIADADLVFLMLDARQLLGQEERFLALEWMTSELGKPIVPIVNFMNFIQPSEQHYVRSLMQSFVLSLRNPLPHAWYGIDARSALRHAVGLDPSPPMDGFPGLKSALQQLGAEQREELKRHSRRAQIQAELRDVDEANHDALTRLEAGDEAIAEDRRSRREEWNGRCRSLELSHCVMRQQLQSEVAKTFDRNREIVLMKVKGATKSQLASDASKWYADAMETALLQAEKLTWIALLDLANEALPRPEPLTVREQHLLTTRLEDPNLGTDPSDVETGFGVIGAVIGTMVLPGVGTCLGAFAGAMFGSLFGAPPHDHSGIYVRKIEELWSNDQVRCSRAIMAQFDERAEWLRKTAAEILADLDKPIPLYRERELRLALIEILRHDSQLAETGV